MKTLAGIVVGVACALAQPIRQVAMATALAAIAIGGASVAAPAQAQALTRVQIPIGGGMNATNRSYSYYVSSKANHDGYNLVVFALHDDGQTAEQFAQSSGWIKLAEDNGFAVVFPEAIAARGPAEPGEGARAGGVWSPVSGDEDIYLKAVYDHASSHLMAAPGPNDAPGPARGGNEGGGAGPGGVHIGTWAPWQYFTGAGSGARVAQEFAMDNPGLVTAVATLNGMAYPAAYARGNEPAQGYFENQRGGHAALPPEPPKKDVPVPAWLVTAGAANADETKLATYWMHANDVAAAGTSGAFRGIPATVYANPHNAVEVVRVSTLSAGAKYDPALTTAIWSFFAHTARWTTSPNGELGKMLTQDEVNKIFTVRETKVGDQTYKYYIKTPSSYVKGKAMPMVVSLHGGGYPSWMFLSMIKWHDLGEKEGFITVYINAPRNRWNFALPDSDSSKGIGQVIDEMAANYSVDRSRVYLQGFSIGSGMTFVEGVTHPQLFAAVSPNSGIGDFGAPVAAYVANLKAKQNIRLPMMVVYGNMDSASSTDGLIPAEGVLASAINMMKKYDGVTTPDTTRLYESPNTKPYEILVPGAKIDPAGIPDPIGRLQRYDYVSADTKQPIFSWVWVRDMPHSTLPDQAQMIWSFFKTWSRNPDGSLTYAAAH